MSGNKYSSGTRDPRNRTGRIFRKMGRSTKQNPGSPRWTPTGLTQHPQHMLFYALSEATLNNAYSNYVRFIREFASITAKQSGKILRGHVTKLLLLYEPKNQNEAIYNGFYGKQCDDCGTWRVEYKFNSDKNCFMLFCYAKGHWNQPTTEALMK